MRSPNRAIALPDRPLMLRIASLGAVAVLLATSVQLWAAAGDLDVAFGDGGRVSTAFFGNCAYGACSAEGGSLVLQLDGKLVQAGETEIPGEDQAQSRAQTDFAPGIEIEIVPSFPTPKDAISIDLVGMWGNSCVPRSAFAARIDRTLTIEIRSLAGICLQVLTPWHLSVPVAPLPEGIVPVTVVLITGLSGERQVLGETAFAVGEGEPSCGDADRSGVVTVTDGVQALRAAASLSSVCRNATCDADNSGTITVTDAVNVLRAAAGLSREFNCPPAADPRR